MSKKTSTSTTAPAASTNKNHSNMVFGKRNYQLMLLGIGVIILGFILMIGTEDIMSFRKITLAPIVVVSGFIIEFFAIFHKPKE